MLLRQCTQKAFSVSHRGDSVKNRHVTSKRKYTTPLVGLNLRDPAIFQQKPTSDLLLAYGILKACSFEPVVKLGPQLLEALEKFSLEGPAYWFMRRTIYKHFVAGESLADCEPAVDALAKLGVGSILDYSVESANKIEQVVEVLLDVIRLTAQKPGARFACFKMTGLTSGHLLDRLNTIIKYYVVDAAGASRPNAASPPGWLALGNQPDYAAFLDSVTSTTTTTSNSTSTSSLPSSGSPPPPLNAAELKEFRLLLQRLERLATTAADLGVPTLIDAEQSYYQDAISFLAIALMKRYNRDPSKLIIYNTYQMYLKASLPTLQRDIELAKSEGYLFGAKLVRGAYMVTEGARAASLNLPSPTHNTIEDTHHSYDSAVSLMLDNVKDGLGGVVIATHNEDSIAKGVSEVVARQLPPDHPRVDFAQLYGMCDHASLALAQKGYRVCKYVPFGPMRDVVPYLVRRMQENQGFVGRTQAERKLMRAELLRRKVFLGPF